VRGNRIKNLLAVKGAAIVRVRDDIINVTRGEPFIDEKGRKRRGPTTRTPAGHGEVTGRIADNTLIYAPVNRLGEEVASDFRQSAFVVPAGVVVDDSNRFVPMDVQMPLQRSVELTPDNLYAYLDSLK
jgi:hypothetical protein